MKSNLDKKLPALLFALLLYIHSSIAQVDVIVDGSFEGGSPSAAWTEFSTNFGTPLCTEVLCGLGGGSQPPTGLWWSYFGGIPATYEESSLSQSVNIPPGSSATLSFYLELPVCDGPADFLKVIIDGIDTVFHVDGGSVLCGQQNYTLQSVSLDSYADGNYHDILFYSVTTANNGSTTNIFVDDVSLMVDTISEYNVIAGKTFIDVNSNGIQDVNEPPVINNKITESNTGRINFSKPDGSYGLIVLDTGNFSVSPEALNYFNTVPVSHSAYFSVFNSTDVQNDFAMQPAGIFNDLCATISPLGNFRSGMNSSYNITYENAGTTILNPTVIFFPDTNVTFDSSIPIASAVTPDSVVWNFGPLAPYQTGNIIVTVGVDMGIPIGTLINSGARIGPLAGDTNPNCNYAYWEVFTTGSFDPNDILVNRNTLLTTEFPNPPFLEYLIRFQNTGNDTAFNVRIFNPLDTVNLQLSTIEFIDSSHPVEMNFIYQGSDMEFTFNNILLPDSNINEPASHGFVRYRIKPQSTLIAGDTIANFASIYFDFNAPVLTNTAITAVVQSSNVNQLTEYLSQFFVYPNPSPGDFMFEFKNRDKENISIELYDIIGNLVLSETTHQSSFIIPSSLLAPGVYSAVIIAGEKRKVLRVVKTE